MTWLITWTDLDTHNSEAAVDETTANARVTELRGSGSGVRAIAYEIEERSA
jgi:hypothetical protein